MVLSELLQHLSRQGLKVSESRLRWALRQGNISRPEIDGSLRFRFSAENVAEIVAYFRARNGVTA